MKFFLLIALPLVILDDIKDFPVEQVVINAIGGCDDDIAELEF